MHRLINLGTGLIILLLGFSGCRAQTTSDDPAAPGQAAPARRLSEEKSPYLRQHADNAVDWYPWSEEAFAKARTEDKLIFLSIGYSTCHWCHVMEEESFMDPEVGKFLREHFVSIKVDRETRPDVDAIYMDFVTRTTGSGGWPLTVFLTPDKVPVFGGTYYPNPARYGRLGFLELLERIVDGWKSDREKITAGAAEFSQSLAAESERAGQDSVPSEAVLNTALRRWTQSYDGDRGGFLPAPKFPSPPVLDFLLRYSRARADKSSEEMVLNTLRAIAKGGIRDHLEGGFHRYSTDDRWLVPHFEKMLYDQAQLARLYSQAYSLGKEPIFKAAAESTFRYLDSRLKSPEGAYYSAEDADSPVPNQPAEHAEGAFYVWTYQELQENLTEEELSRAQALLGVLKEGNASGDPLGELKGKNVLYLTGSDLGATDQPLISKLTELRNQRPRPNRDEKILTEWNAMTASAYADAGRYFDNPSYIATARAILTFIEDSMVVDGSLVRSFLEGSSEVDAFAVDYIQLVDAYLALHQAGGNPRDLARAVHWQNLAEQKFWDKDNGGYFDTLLGTELPYRNKERTDGATYSANSRAALNLTTLYQLTGNSQYRDRLEGLLKDLAPVLEESPTAAPGALSALMHWYGSHESVIVNSPHQKWWRVVVEDYHPERVLIRVASEADHASLTPLVPFLPGYSSTSAAYGCRDFSCGLPITDFHELRAKKWR